ncbi:MAG: TetR family transcriptional regulator [Acidimicrobiales bacterium]
MSRTGRRPGSPDTREAILEAALRGFGARGYEATSLRSIAEDAGVDPALLIHYFGTKENLFTAALRWPVRPSEMFPGLEAAGAAEAAELIVRMHLNMLDNPQHRDDILALVRSAVSNAVAARMLREFVTEALLVRLSSLIDKPDSRLRASLIAAQLVGIAMLRHVVQLEPLVGASNDEIACVVAPVIESYLR